MLRAGPTQKQAPSSGSWLGKRAATNDDDEDERAEGPDIAQREEEVEVQEQPLPESKKAKRAAQEQQLLANSLNPMPCYPPVDPGTVAQVYPPLASPVMPTYPPVAPLSAVPGVHSMYAGGFNAYPNPPSLPTLTPSLYPFGTPSLFRPPTWSPLVSTVTPQTPSASLPPPPPLPSNGVLANNNLSTLAPYANIRPPLLASSAVVPPPGPPPLSVRPPSFSLQQPIQQLQQQIQLQQLQLQQMRPPLPSAPVRGPTVLTPGFPLRSPPVGTVSR